MSDIFGYNRAVNTPSLKPMVNLTRCNMCGRFIPSVKTPSWHDETGAVIPVFCSKCTQTDRFTLIRRFV